jgi:hypothetical protein
VASEKEKLGVELGAADTIVAMKMQILAMACIVVAKGDYEKL